VALQRSRHEFLERGWRVLQPERHHPVLVRCTIRRRERGEVLRRFVHWDLPVPGFLSLWLKTQSRTRTRGARHLSSATVPPRLPSEGSVSGNRYKTALYRPSSSQALPENNSRSRNVLLLPRPAFPARTGTVVSFFCHSPGMGRRRNGSSFLSLILCVTARTAPIQFAWSLTLRNVSKTSIKALVRSGNRAVPGGWGSLRSAEVVGLSSTSWTAGWFRDGRIVGRNRG
jgi:hypothetical protein